MAQSPEGASTVGLLTSEIFRDNDLTDIHSLVSQLSTSKEWTLEEVAVNMEGALASPTTQVLYLPDLASRIRAMLTVNDAPTLHGIDPWIDDVVVDGPLQGKKWSKTLMNYAEDMSAILSDRVRLTSKLSRVIARAGYEKRGYVLQEETVIRRKTKFDQGAMPEGVATDWLDYNDSDVEQLAGLLNQDPFDTDEYLRLVIASPTTTLLTSSNSRGRLTGAATINFCPIPVGSKAWLDIETAASDEEQHKLIAGAEKWTQACGKTALNILFEPPAGVEGYGPRDSGLFVLDLANRVA